MKRPRDSDLSSNVSLLSSEDSFSLFPVEKHIGQLPFEFVLSSFSVLVSS